jgi:hypothetical protein
MSTQKSKIRLASIIIAASVALIVLAAACGGPKTVQKPDNEPGLRENKAQMMNRMDTTMRK